MQDRPTGNKLRGTTLLDGERPSYEEVVRCLGCHHPVCVPYAGAVTCPVCRHETHWLSRYDHARRKSAIPIAEVIVSR